MFSIDFWRWETLLIVTGLLGVISFNLKSKLLQGIFIYAVFSAVRVFLAPISPYFNASAGWQFALDNAAVSAIFLVILYTYAIQSKSLSFWLRAFQWVGVINWLTIIGGAAFDAPNGILLNPSMSGCFQVCLLPLFFLVNPATPYLPFVSIIGSIAAILLTGQSLPILCLFTLAIGFYVQRRDFRAALLLPAFPVFMGAPYWLPPLVNDNGRFFLWEESLKWWWTNANVWLGAGAGSFAVIGPYISRNFGFDPALNLRVSIFHTLHNDWAQILFEGGLLGLTLAAAAYAVSLWRAKDKPHIFLSLWVYGFFMLANFPLHHPLSAYFAFLLAFVSNSRQSSGQLSGEHT